VMITNFNHHQPRHVEGAWHFAWHLGNQLKTSE
jgi:hypothetical protein